MNNKKGFTLVEIIVSITLLLLIGGVVTFSLVKNNSGDNVLSKLEEKVFDATAIYIANEKDEIGNLYIDGIAKGGEGAIVPLVDLYNTGYLEKKDYEEIIKFVNDDEEYIIVGYKSAEDCETGTTIEAGWVNKTTYICGIKKTNPPKNNSVYSTIINQDYNTQCKSDNFSGLCHLHTLEDNENDPDSDGTVSDVWYFKGNVENNYLKFEGLEKVFRIVRTTENNGIKIVENDPLITDLLHSGDHMSLRHKIDRATYIYKGSGNKITTIIRKFPDGSGSSYECIEPHEFTSWDISTTYNCKNESGSSIISYPHPIYSCIYKPLYDNYENIKTIMEQYIDKEYNWCLSDNSIDSSNGESFKCSEAKSQKGDFGLLNLFEYANIQYIQDLDADSSSQYIYNNYIGTSVLSDEIEFAMGKISFTSTIHINPGYNRGWSSTYTNVRLRPSYVIKGNSLIISGEGTETNPYIISGSI